MGAQVAEARRRVAEREAASRLRSPASAASYLGGAGQPHTRQRTRSQATDPRLRQADLAADLSQGQSPPIREHQDAPFERREVTKRARDERPTLIAMLRCAMHLGHVADPIK